MITTTLAVHIRRAGVDDRLDLAEMLLRCSPETRYRRFHGYLETFPEPYFSGALAGRPEHFALVGETHASVVALASSVRGELGVLVEDSCQRQGIGTRLLETLIARSGHGLFRASVLPDQTWILPFLRRYSQITIEIA
jgi:GNAT superfamily N-acetyltransferase